MKPVFLLLVLAFGPVFGQDYERKELVVKNDTLPYRVLLPENYDPKKAYPLLLFLHGAGERGNDNSAQLIHGAELFQEASFRKQYPAIIVFPQCPKSSYWANVSRNPDDPEKRFVFSERLKKNPQLKMVSILLRKLNKAYSIDPNQRYVGGLSMGGMGTFELIARNSNYFAGAFAICGGAHPNWAKKLKKTPLWIFHGEKDGVVNVSFSKIMQNAILEAGGKSQLTLYPGVNHNSWENAFADPELFSWLFMQRKK